MAPVLLNIWDDNGLPVLAFQHWSSTDSEYWHATGCQFRHITGMLHLTCTAKALTLNTG